MYQRFSVTIDQEIVGLSREGSSMSPLPARERPVLRLHDPADPSPPEPGDERRFWPLRRCWEEFVLPASLRDGRSEASRSDHRTALAHWEAIFEPRQQELAEQLARQEALKNPRIGGLKPPDPQENHRTAYPVVCQCHDFDLLQFYADQLRKPVEPAEGDLPGRGVGHHQARKCLSAVKLILRESRRRKLLSEIPEVSPGEPPRKKKPGQVVCREVEKLIRAGWRVAAWPRIGRLEPGFVWETWLLLFWLYGARTQDFVPYKSAKLDGLCWPSVCFDAACPDETLLDDDGEVLRSTHGWLRWQPQKTARSKGEEILLPLHSEAAKRLRRFVGLDSQRVFTHGRTKGNRRTGSPGFVTTFDAIVEAAGLGREVTIAGSGAGSRSIRKGCSNNWDALQDGLGEWVLGHARQGVHKSHYKDATRRFVELIEQLKIPRVEHLPLFD